MRISKYPVLILFISSFFAISCAKLSSPAAPVVEYAQACTDANKDKEIAVQGFLSVTDKVPCVKLLNSKRNCGFKLMDTINITGSEIIAYLAEGTEKNQAETPDAGKSYYDLKPSIAFTRNEVKFRLDDGTLIAPREDIATPVTLTGKVNLTEDSSVKKICLIMATKVEKR